MFRKIGRVICLIALLVAGLCLFGGGSSALTTQEEEALNDKCIRCHVVVYTKSVGSSQKHQPSFERQCIVCHLAPDSGWRTTQEGQAAVTITGVPVADQKSQWRKTLFFVSAGPQTTHEAVLLGLPENKAYRFRIVVSDSPKPGAGQQQTSKWLGLVPSEVPELSGGSGQGIAISDTGSDAILAPSLQRLGAVVVRWQSVSMSFGWVELQEMEGVSLPQMAVDQTAAETGSATGGTREEEHPLLVSYEYATIDLCFTCHAESGLGASHPVRIYATGKETRIPESLPTGKDGMLTCVTCHDPHGGKGKALVRELIVTKLCVACHHTFNRTSKSTMF